MRQFFLALLFFAIGFKIVAQSDTTKVQVFSFKDPSPTGWGAPYVGEANFPENGEWRKIIMVQHLKCDTATNGDQYPCGEWDYFTNTIIYVPVNDTVEEFELGSFITPYGKRLEMGGEKGWIWEYDLTDYAPLLKGKLKIKSGNNQELLDLKFLFISGKPARNSLSVQNIWPTGNYKYEYLANDSILKERKILLDKNASGFRVKSRISGHGHFGPHNCCEWDNKTHWYSIGDWEQLKWNVWKDCGFNPIYPQGGTWPFDRAGWCPGTKVDENEFEITDYVQPGDTLPINYSIENYRDNGEKDGDYRMSHQLFQFGKPNFGNDAELYEIIAPSSKDEYSRINPVCCCPRIIIKNTGKNTLKTVLIKYGFSEGKKMEYQWSGNLEFLETETVYLPDPEWKGKTFTVELVNPNGIPDENKANNKLVSVAKESLVLPAEFIIHIETNDLDRARENSYTISNSSGKLMYAGEGFKDDTEYDHEIKLASGCYEFLLTDKFEDGMMMHWWYWNEDKSKVGKNGKITILSKDGKTELHVFPYDFGQELLLNFKVD